MVLRVMTSIIGHLRAGGAAILLAGCAVGTSISPTATPSHSAMTSPPASTSPSPLTSASPSPDVVEPTVRFSFPDGAEPAVTRAMTGLRESYINPGAVVEDADGTLHMYANVFTQFPASVRVMHLTSPDAAVWTLASPEPVLDREDVPFAGLGIDVADGLIGPDGSWILVFEALTSGAAPVIGVATGPGPNGPWSVEPEPVLAGGKSGSWDAGGLVWPSVATTDDGFAMYYTALGANPGEGVIGRATARDGLTWTKDDGPVLVPAAAWEGTGLDRAQVIRLGERYLMLYATEELTNRGAAFSDDGIDWQRDGDVPAITADDFPVTGRSWDGALIERDGVLTFYLEIGSPNPSSGTQVYRLTAPVP
jgi:predicted GH43/DUF377 family glycosyl hydrolase